MYTEFNKLVISSYFFRRRIKTLIRLFYLFIMLTVLLTAYLYGLIEIDSQKVVIKIIPSSFNFNNKNNLVNKNKLNDDNNSNNVNNNNNKNNDLISDNDYINNANNRFRMNNNNNLNSKSSQMEQQVGNRKRKFQINPEHFLFSNKKELEKNLTFLFSTVDRFQNQIRMPLKPQDAENIYRLKVKYETLVRDRQNKMKEEFKEELRRNNNNQDVDLDALNDTMADNYDDITLMTQLESDELVSRDVLVKFLRYEKYKLKKKLKKPITNIKNLINEFNLQKELDLSELPPVWHKYFYFINELHLYNDTKVLNDILHSMATSTVVSCNEKERGTQIKLLLLLSDGTDVLVKPMKVPRDYETPPDHFYFVDFERHHAEIAAFHVDKLLEFFRVPPTVGRVFNMSSDLWHKADPELAKTFFYSPAGNTCFTGHCSYYCDTTHAICGRPLDRMEGSVQLMLPNKPLIEWKISSHPYRRTYNKKRKAEWETNENYCVDNVFQDVTYQSKLLLDLIDMSIFDFITGNMDRHHYERMISLGNDTFSLHLDNGRSFGKQFHDEMSILAPLKQCCLIRYSTFLRLKYLYKNNFSALLDESLKSDPLYPILTSNHLKAIDRRLVIILNELNKCIEKVLPSLIFIDDGY